MGRKTLYKKEYCGLLLDLMREGGSVVRFCADTGICRDTFFEWVRRYKLFSDTYKKGKELCESYWETKCREAIFEGGGKFNTGLFCFYMKNRFGWKDSPEPGKDGVMKPDASGARTVNVKNLIMLNAERSGEERERIIGELERIGHEDKPGRGAGNTVHAVAAALRKEPGV